MKEELHIFTVGTSLISNFSKSGTQTEETKKLRVDQWLTSQPSAETQTLIKRIAEEGKSNPVFCQMVEFVTKNPSTASAELNAFISFEKLHGKKTNKRICLLTTDTVQGVLCANLLRTYLSENGYEVLPIKVIKGFGVYHHLFDNALSSLMNEILSIARVSKDSRLYLNATGGFKPETCFAVVAALLAQNIHGVYYIHENFRSLVFLPTPPLELPAQLKEKLSKLHNFPKSALSLLSISEEELQMYIEKKLVKEDGKGHIVVEDWVKPLLGIE